MDTAGTGNKGSGSAADDLWKKVLKDVSTEAAQRRQKIAARTVSAVAKVAPGDSELLKRVLLALEAKPNGEANAQIEAILKKLLEAVTALPREVPDHSDKLKDVDRHIKDLARNLGEFLRKQRDDKPAIEPKQIVDPLLDALAKNGTTQSEAIAKAIGDATSAQREASERQAQLLTELSKQIGSLPQSPDLRPQLEALKQTLESLQAAAAQQSQAVTQEVARVLSEQPRPADHGEKLQQIQDQVAAVAAEVSKPAPEQPAPLPSVDPAKVDELLAKVQAIAEKPTVDPTESLKEIREQVAALAAAQAPPIDPARLEELHASVKQLADSPAIDAVRELKAEIEELRKSSQQPAITEKLDALTASIESLPKSDAAGKLDELLQAVRGEPQTPPAVTDKLNEIAQAIAQRPDDGRDVVLLQILETVQAMQASQKALAEQPSAGAPSINTDEVSDKVWRKVSDSIGERFDQLLDRMSKLEQSHGSTAGALAASEGRLDQIASRLEGQKPVADEDMLSRMLGEVKQPIADQQTALSQLLQEQKQRDEAQAAQFQQVLDKLDAVASQRGSEDGVQPLGDVRRELTAILESLNKQVRTDPGPVLLKILDKLDALARGSIDGNTIKQMREQAAAPPAEITEALAKIQEAVTQPTDDSQKTLLAEVLAAVKAIADRPAPQSPDVAALAEPIRAELAAGTQAMREESKVAREQMEARLGAVEARVTEQAAAVSSTVQAQTAALRDELLLATTQEDQQIEARIDSLRRDLKDQITSLRDELTALAGAMPSAQPKFDDGAIQPVLAAIEALPRDDARSAAEQRKTLEELVSLVKATREQVSTDSKSDVSPKVLEQLGSLSDANRQTQKTLQRIIELLGSQPAGQPLSISASVTEGDSSAPRYTPTYRGRSGWGEVFGDSSRSTRVALVAAAIALGCIFGVMFINLFRGPEQGPTNTPVAGQPNPNTVAANTTPNKSNTPTTDSSKSNVNSNAGTSGTKDSSAASKLIGPDGQVKLFPDPTPADPNDTKVHTPLVNEIGKLVDPTSPANGNTKLPLLQLADAEKVVFLVHASGNSAATKATIVSELKRHLSTLDPKQQFAIVIAEGVHFTEVPPAGLKDSTNAELRKAELWIDVNIRGGRTRTATSPLVALDVAMEYQPDLLWIVTDGIAGDQPGQIKPAELIKRIATLNKENKVHVAGTQVGAEDPSNTLKLLSEQFGGQFEQLGQAETSSRGGE